MASLRKNVSSQNFTFALVSASTGAGVTGATVSVFVTKDNGAQASGAGTVTEAGNGQYNYAPTQAETNATDVGFLFTATGAIPVNLDFHTDVVDGNGLLQVDLVDIAGSAVSTTTAQLGVNVVNFGGTAQTGRDIGASVLLSPGTGTGQLNISAGNLAGPVPSVTGAVGSVTGNVGGSVGSVTGAVGSVTGNVGGSVASVTGAVGSVTGNVGGNVVGSVASVTDAVTVGTNNDKTGYALTTTANLEISTTFLNTDMSAVTITNTFSPQNAFRFLRNKWGVSGTTLTVFTEDGTTTAWTGTVTTNATAAPIVGATPT